MTRIRRSQNWKGEKKPLIYFLNAFESVKSLIHYQSNMWTHLTEFIFAFLGRLCSYDLKNLIMHTYIIQ